MLRGIDFAYGSGITAEQITAAGFHFVARYLTGTNNPKDISAEEIKNYRAAGVQIVFVFETSGQEYSQAQGTQDASAAQSQLAELAAGVGDATLAEATMFFAQDIPENSGVDPTAYQRGVVGVIGIDRSGAYSKYSTIQSLFNAGVIKYGWQTYGGSSGAWDGRALLRQVLNGIKVGPCDCDSDEAAFWDSAKILGSGDDYGQWPRPTAPSGPYRHVTDGTKTWNQICAERNANPVDLAEYSVQHYTVADYEALGEVKAKGAPYYTKNP